MTLSLAIRINCAALLRVVAMLFEASGMVAGKPAMLPRIIRGSVLHRLRPAESAARRLVMIVAQELEAKGLKPRAKRPAPTQPIPRGDGSRAPVFPLFDPRKRFEKTGRRFAKGDGPRLSFLDGSDPVREQAPETPTAAAPDAPMDATRLCRRLEALQLALQDLPKQARRLVRMQARRKTPRSPMRPGRPPGHRTRGRFEVDEILRECHLLALRAVAAPDTS